MKKSKTDTVLISMLRQKQQRLGVKYFTRDSGIYKFFAFLFYISFIWAFITSILFVISVSVKLNINISYIEDLNGLQKEQIPTLRNSIYSAAVFTLLLLPSPFFLKSRKNILNLIFAVVPSAVLLLVFYGAMSENINGGIYLSFVLRHFVPLVLIIISSAICGIIAVRQQIRDKKGISEISEKIYNRYSLLADKITEEQWQEILSEYGEPVKKKKHRHKGTALSEENKTESRKAEDIKTEKSKTEV